jgi:hypothetical protein
MLKNKLDKTRKTIIIILPVLFAVLCIFFVLSGSYTSDDSTVKKMSVSEPSGFYSSDIYVKVTVPKKAKVFYTMDCSEPTEDNGTLYESPITIPSGEKEEVYTLRFKAVYNDGKESKVITRTYVTGVNIQQRYDMDVLLITGEPDELFGYEDGIFVTGKTFDEFMENNPDADLGAGIEANFTQKGRDSERKVSAQYFNSDGTMIFDMNVGIRIRGGATRLKNQKSFTLYARSEYDEQNKFEYPFLDRFVSTKTGTIAQKYKQLVLRNSGNDNGFAFVRDELVANLADDAGFMDVMYCRPVCVYINGIYQGTYWLQNSYDSQYFENKYGEYDGEFISLEGGDAVKLSDEDAEKQKYVDEYNALYADFSGRDLTDDENFSELCSVIDIENYLQYCAIENYVGNYDWPDNNERVYRYVASDGETYEKEGAFDGRYRFMLYDADYGFGLLVVRDSIGIMAGTKTLERMLSDKMPLFTALMEREDCRDYFTAYTCRLINGAMSAENVSKTLDELHASHYNELYYMLEETDLLKNSLWTWESDDNLSIDYVNKCVEYIKAYAAKRPGVVIEDIQETFGYGDTYSLNVDKGSSQGSVEIDGLCMDNQEFSGIYFEGIQLTITAKPADNEIFDYFLVNGRKCTEPSLVIESDDIQDGNVNVTLVTHFTDEPKLSLSAVRSKGTGDFIELVNLSDKIVTTKGYYLTDDENLYKYTLPSTVLNPGETIRIYGKDSLDPESLGEFEMNFNLKTGEIITLSYMEDIVEQLELPKLSVNGVYKKDYSTGKFREYLE